MSAIPLTVTLRADAGVDEGSGHVMRSLTLARAVAARGHRVLLAVTVDGLPWLDDVVTASGLERLKVRRGELDAAALRATGADRVVVDSYVIDAQAVSELDREVPVLAIVDGLDRGIHASAYLDQNLGAEVGARTAGSGRLLAGPRYALIRPEVLAARRAAPWLARSPARVLAFMGGTDATDTIVEVARALAGVGPRVVPSVVVGSAHRRAVEDALAGSASARVLAPTPRLADLYADADIVVAAAGTSAWEVSTLGIPAVLIGVVENQRSSLRAAVARGLVLGIDLVEDPASIGGIGAGVTRLLDEPKLRRALSTASTALFDGRGAARVAEALEAL